MVDNNRFHHRGCVHCVCVYRTEGNGARLTVLALTHTYTQSCKGGPFRYRTTFLINAVYRTFGGVLYFPPWDIAEAEFLDEIQIDKS
jgi:hypothetical protein